MFAQDSIELLKQSGIDFAKMEARGIDVSNFGELLMSSGIVLNEDVSHIELKLQPAMSPMQLQQKCDHPLFATGQVDYLPQRVRFWVSTEGPDMPASAKNRG